MEQTLPGILQQTAKKYPQEMAFFSRPNKASDYQGISWQDLYQQAIKLASALAKELQVKPGDHVVILADNRLEWILADFAILMNGAADVPRATDINDAEIDYIINHSDAEIVLVENKKMLKRVQSCLDKLPKVRACIIMEENFEGDGKTTFGLHELLHSGQENDALILERMAAISPDDRLSLIYTSGTTGTPKGVMLSHANMVYLVTTMVSLMDIHHSDRALSLLPIWHVFERVIEYIFVAAGASTYYTSVRTLSKDMVDVQPTLMGSAPRLWESIYEKILAKVKKGSSLQQKLFNLAMLSSSKTLQAQRFFSGTLHSIWPLSGTQKIQQSLQHALNWSLWIIPAKLLAFIPHKLLKITGGQLRATISSGGALPPHIDEFFNNIGIPLLEGYGMTECSPIISLRKPEHLVMRTVGPAIPGCEVQIRNLNTLSDPLPQGESGVLFVKGPQVMQGYYKNAQATQDTMLDGWLNTGDIARINHDQTISITGRSKETIVLLSGENVEPVPIENKLLESDYIFQIMVTGQDKKSLTSLIILDEEKIQAWAKQQKQNLDNTTLTENPAVRQLIKQQIHTLVSNKNGFKAFEKITDFTLLDKAFEVGDELTKLFKIKRHVVAEKYQNQIDSMYNK